MRKTLMTQIASEETLYEAWRKVRANKGAAGSDAVTIPQFEERLDAHLAGLGRCLREETYLPDALRQVALPKPDGSVRELAIPTVMDRVAQRAFVDVLEPLFEAQFLDCSWGFRPGRGVDGAVRAVLGHRQAGHDWIVDADITHFFASIHIPLLMEQLRQTISDRAVLRTIHLWLAAGTLAAPVGSGARKWLRSVAVGTREVSQEVINHLLGREGWPPAWAAMQDGEIGEAETERRQTWRTLGRDAALAAFQFRHLLVPCLTGNAAVIGGGIGAVALGAAALACRNTGRSDSASFGAPQGAPLSPLLANVYLHRFDKTLTRRGLRLVRYADDFVICCASSPRTRHALETARQELAALHLTLNAAKTHVVPKDCEFVFLGHLFDSEGAFPHPDEKRSVGAALNAARQQGHRLASDVQTGITGILPGVGDRVRGMTHDASCRLRLGARTEARASWRTKKGEA